MPEDLQAKPRRRGIRIDPSDLALEILSIVIAILLALAVNRWQEGRAHDRTLHDALLSIRQEIVDNRTRLTQTRDLHQRVSDAFWHLSDQHQTDTHITFRQVYVTFKRAAPQGFQPFKGEDIAWQIAQGTQAASYMPYRVRAALTRVYGEQADLYTAEQRFVDAMFSQSGASRDFYVQAFAATLWLTEVANDERELARRYDEALRVLPAS